MPAGGRPTARSTKAAALPLAALAAFALASCGTPEEKVGTFGNGSFAYDCVGAQDPSCPGAVDLTPQAFPSAIAYGGRFSVSYLPDDGATYPNVTVQAVSDDFFVTDVDAFEATRTGTPWLVATAQDGTILDITPIAVEPVASIRIADVTSGVALDDTATTHTFGATAIGALGQTLAGDVPCAWVSSDPSVAAIQDQNGDSSRVTVMFAAAGTATLTASTSTAQGSITVDVSTSL